jgi:hypothetical protein
MGRDELLLVLEALKSCWSEIEAMESTYEDYVASGRLAEQVEAAITILEGHSA